MMDELAKTIGLARELFPMIGDVVKRDQPQPPGAWLSRGSLEPGAGACRWACRSFDNGLLKKMARYNKYGSAEQIMERIQSVAQAKLFKVAQRGHDLHFPGQTPEMIEHDIACVKASGANQTTFYPLMVSPASRASIEKTVGKVDYKNEERFYHQIYDASAGATTPSSGRAAATRSAARKAR